MKLISLVLIGALLVGGIAQAQTPSPPSQPARASGLQAIPPQCKEAAQRLCGGKQGQDAVNCLKSHQDKVPAKCKAQMPQ